MWSEVVDVLCHARESLCLLQGVVYTPFTPKIPSIFHQNASVVTLEQVIDHYQALFGFIQFVDETQGLFAPEANGQGCNQGECGISPIPESLIPGLLAYLRKLELNHHPRTPMVYGRDGSAEP